jgi:hypothetical protein
VDGSEDSFSEIIDAPYSVEVYIESPEESDQNIDVSDEDLFPEMADAPHYEEIYVESPNYLDQTKGWADISKISCII